MKLVSVLFNGTNKLKKLELGSVKYHLNSAQMSKVGKNLLNLKS